MQAKTEKIFLISSSIIEKGETAMDTNVSKQKTPSALGACSWL